MALWDGDNLVDVAVEPDLSAEVVRDFVAERGPVSHIMYCSVVCRGDKLLKNIRHLATGRVLRLKSDMNLPIKIEYGTPGTLGADRIAAAVGAISVFPDTNLLVVDAGTAVTYDAVTDSGRFIGGNIAPGMRMRLDALHRYTARLPLVEVPREINYERFMGNDTASAMILGAVYGIVGAISYYHSHLPKDTKVVMTGGWARELSNLCDFPVAVEPNLVSKGLNRILLYNENK